jgi:aminoglycoside phosphotransferase (APT) family kinase protein
MAEDSETIPVRPAHRFPTERLAQMLADRLGARLAEVRQMRGGQSNPTFLLITDRDEYVLRKQPPGALLPSAHAVDREYRVLAALAGTAVPVPRPLLYGEDPTIIGTPFYVMERLRGRIFRSPTLPDLAAEARRPVYLAMADTLAKLHRVDWAAQGLADYGKSGNYFARQIARWAKQWQASQTRRNPAIDNLADWLPNHIPPGDQVSLCHGDFRLDNMVFHPSEPRVIGLLDWELSTLGHPLADLAYNCIPYVMAPDIHSGLLGLDLAALGIPDQAEYLAAYAAGGGTSEPLQPFHLAFSLFRLAVILEGVLARAQAGNASSSEAGKVGARGIALADCAWQLVG